MKKEDEEDVKQPEITSRDIENLRGELKRFPQTRINGRLISPFEQYLISLNVMKYSNDGVVVHDAVGYTRMSKINSKLELRQFYEDQEHFAAFPEAKEAQLEKISSLKKELAGKIKT